MDSPGAAMGSPGAAANGLVTVSGTNIMRDGVRWIPHGFYQIAFEVPPGHLADEKKFWADAQHGYTPTEYTQMRQFGADCVRLQVAQTGVDPLTGAPALKDLLVIYAARRIPTRTNPRTRSGLSGTSSSVISPRQHQS